MGRPGLAFLALVDVCVAYERAARGATGVRWSVLSSAELDERSMAVCEGVDESRPSLELARAGLTTACHAVRGLALAGKAVLLSRSC